MKISRRELGLLIPAVAAAQQLGQPQGARLPSKAYAFEDLAVKTNGPNKSRAVLNGETHAGLAIELHITELGPGQTPHAPHKHVHEEVLMLQAGMLDATIGGVTARVTAGSVVYLASNDEHGWRNPGTEPARYFVMAIGRDA